MNREEAIKLLENDEERPCTDECCASFTCEECKFFQALNMALDALKEERPHGEWKADGTCSECGIYSSLNKAVTYFCPNCGAKMKEGEEK